MWEYEISCRISTNKNSIVIAMLQKLLDHPYLTIGSIIAISVLTRMAFQYYRRRQRRCHCCGSTNIIRSHIVTRMVDFSDNSGMFRLYSETTHQCLGPANQCSISGIPEVVKSYVILVPAHGFSFRRWKYRKLLPTHPTAVSQAVFR